VSDERDTIHLNVAEPVLGVQVGSRPLRVHPLSECEGRDLPCVIHSPSDHHMASWPLNWRADTQVMERICEHGTGHPDPDHMAYVRSLTPEHDCIDDLLMIHPEHRASIKDVSSYGRLCKYPHLEWQGVHGCDRCC
jgi:hypothetical protein